MKKSITEIKNIWENNKEGFKVQEIGKLQDFIKDILKCKHLFNLKYGDYKKEHKSRKYEFTSETTKEDGRADIVIFIDGNDVIIPLEIEKYGDIKAGENQILKYQTNWRKKYGILTDGNEWRFYFDNWYTKFELEKDILNKNSEFWKKWELYISKENYYNMVFDTEKQGYLFETPRLNPGLPEYRPFFFNDITNLLSNFKIKIIALFPFFDVKNSEKQAIETTYSYIIQFILYKVLIDNNYSELKNDYESFKEWVKISLKEKKYDGIIKDIKKISEYICKNIYEPFRKKQEIINKRLIEQIKKTAILEEISPWLDIIMFIDRYDFSNIKNELFGFVYENYLKELYNNENKGQYFTDPSVVNFMLKELGYTKENIEKNNGNNISIIDPSCGAGTFLYSATLAIKEAFDKGTLESSKLIENFVNNSIYGLDIEEFPLFLAEMNILMQLLPIAVGAKYKNVINNEIKVFKTNDSIAEFLCSSINNKNEKDNNGELFNDFNKNKINSYMRKDKDLWEMFKSLKDTVTGRQRFDYVVGNPPYIGYNRCTNLPFAKKIKDKSDFFSMGNVYGVNLNTVPNRRKPYPPKPNLYAFFIALGLGLLKDNGKICYIIPQTMLTAGDLDVLRYHLAKYTTIEKIITFEGNMFIGRGLKQKKPVPTSSLIFVAKKAIPKKEHVTKIINYKPYTEKQAGDFGIYLNNRKKLSKTILQSDLLDNIENWNIIKQNEDEQILLNIYKSNNTYSIEEYRKFELNNYDEICLDGGLDLNNQKITKEYNINSYKVFNPKINNYTHLLTTPTNLYYPLKAEINFIPGGQGMKAFLYKYKIIWKTRFIEKFQLCVEENIILNGNQSLVISSNNKNVILFLLGLLNSSVSMYILKKMVKLPNEAKYIVALATIKQYIRIPKITQENNHIKKEIIKQVETLIELETPVIKDYVKFSNDSVQNYKTLSFDNNVIKLTAQDNTCKGTININKFEIVKQAINKKYNNESSLVIEKEININELKFLPVIDIELQNRIKNYIDDLVFALYFNIQLLEIDFEKAEKIKNIVSKNNNYLFINS